MTTEPSDHVKRRTRSPAYPSFGLEEAIRKADILYEEEDRHQFPVDSMAHHWETKVTSSGFLQAISALKQFGLLTDQGTGSSRRLRLSELALDLLAHDEGSPRRAELIKEAALTPKIHRELWDAYFAGGGSPPSDSTIRVYLLRERTPPFNKDSVDALIGQFRATIAFANLRQSDIMPERVEEEESHSPSQSMVKQPQPQPPPPSWSQQRSQEPPTRTTPHLPPPVGFRDLPVTLPSLEIAVLRVPVPMSEEDYETLTNALTAMKRALVRDNPATPPAASSGE
jgi:hypothetical protein